MTGFVQWSLLSGLGSAELELAGMTARLDDDDGPASIEFGAITFRSRFDMDDEEVPLREVFARLEKLHFDGPSAMVSGRLEQAELEQLTSREGRDRYRQRFRSEVQTLEFAGQSFGPMAIELEASNLDAEGIQALSELQAGERDERDLGEITGLLSRVATQSPSLALRRLYLETPGGPIKASGHLEIDGAALGPGMNAGLELMDAADLEFRLEMPEELLLAAAQSELARRAASSGPHLDVHGILGVLVELGYVERDEGQLRTSVSRVGSLALKVNGKAFSPDRIAIALSKMPQSQPAPPPVVYRPPEPSRIRTYAPAASDDVDPQLREMRRKMGLE